MRKPLIPIRTFNHTRLDANCETLNGFHENELFYNCTFKNLRGLTLKNCVLRGSKFLTDDVNNTLDFTMTLDCMSFKGVEYSPLLFDLYLVLAIMTKGNDEKRQKLVDLVGRERVREILEALANLE